MILADPARSGQMKASEEKYNKLDKSINLYLYQFFVFLYYFAFLQYFVFLHN